MPTIRTSAVQTFLFWRLLKIYASPIAVNIFVTFFKIVTIAIFMYFRLKNQQKAAHEHDYEMQKWPDRFVISKI